MRLDFFYGYSNNDFFDETVGFDWTWKEISRIIICTIIPISSRKKDDIFQWIPNNSELLQMQSICDMSNGHNILTTIAKSPKIV